MIEIRNGDLLESDTEALVNTVNTVGVMGKGIALQFKRRFPENYRLYAAACRHGEVEIGRMFVTTADPLEGPRAIVNFPTKRHWRNPSLIGDIEAGLPDLRSLIERERFSSVAIPPLGCGLGGLRWDDVRPRIEDALSDLDAQILLFAPSGAPAKAALGSASRRPKMTLFRAALIDLVRRYARFGESLTPLVTQKLLYFLQEAGENLQLRFERNRFGPYADRARHAAQALEGHYLVGFGDGTEWKQISLLPGAEAEAKPALEANPQTVKRLDRVSELIEGFETPYSLELLASTHWLAVHEHLDDPSKAALEIASWNPRKARLFGPRDVQLAWDHLEETGWLGQRGLPGLSAGAPSTRGHSRRPR